MICFHWTLLLWIGGGLLILALIAPILAMFYFPRIW